MAVITVGSEAIDRESSFQSGYTLLSRGNPASASGFITAVDVFGFTNSGGSPTVPHLTDLRVGTFFGTGTTYECRDFAIIGSVTSGSKQTITDLHIAVQAGDLIGCYYSAGRMEYAPSGGPGVLYKAGDQTETGEQQWALASGGDAVISLQGIGATPKPPTPAVTPYVGLPYRVEVRDVDGHLIAIPRAVFSGQLTRSLNMPDGLSFEIAADDPACKYMTPRYELWVPDLSLGEIVSVCKAVMTEASDK